MFSHSCQQCPKLAIIQEDEEGCTIKIDGVCKCPNSTVQDVIQSKVAYIKFFQGTNPLTSLSATELKALKSVADKIDRGLDPLPSVNDNIALLNKFGPETVERIAKRYYEPTAQVFYAEQVPEEGPEDVHQQAAPPQDPTPQASSPEEPKSQASSPEEPTSDTSTSNASTPEASTSEGSTIITEESTEESSTSIDYGSVTVGTNCKGPGLPEGIFHDIEVTNCNTGKE